MRITFPSSLSDQFVVTAETASDMTRLTDNAASMLHCEKHPIKEDPKRVLCDPDYQHNWGLPESLIFQSMQELFSDNNTFVRLGSKVFKQ